MALRNVIKSRLHNIFIQFVKRKRAAANAARFRFTGCVDWGADGSTISRRHVMKDQRSLLKGYSVVGVLRCVRFNQDEFYSRHPISYIR
jgi:hypothetical protein